MAHKDNELDPGVVRLSKDLREQIKQMYLQLEAPFEPLGASVRHDYEVAHGPAMKDLVKRCKQENIPLPHTLQDISDDWRSSLNEETMSEYCSAASGFMESRLLKSGAPLAEAHGLLVDIEQDPRFAVTSRPGSLLEDEAGALDANQHVYGVSEFAAHIAGRCDVNLGKGELAWRFIAALLQDIDSAVFPGVTTRPLHNRILVELRQVPR